MFNAENEMRFKLFIPTTLKDSEHIGQTIFGREVLKISYADVVSQCWQALADKESALCVIDDGVYGSNAYDGNLAVTLLRSAGYGAGGSAWGEPFREPMYQQRMDQGERRYRFRVMAGKRDDILLRADREAAQFNQKAYALAFCPSGNGTKPKELISVDRENVTLSCFKQSERDAAKYIFRLFEAQGTECDAHIELPIAGVSLDTHFTPFEIKTFMLADGKVTETDMLEGAVPLSNE